MSDHPKSDGETYSEEEANARAARALRRMLQMPPKPHKEMKKGPKVSEDEVAVQAIHRIILGFQPPSPPCATDCRDD
jgi:hypothetical protein